jgi:hypothetical protein
MAQPLPLILNGKVPLNPAIPLPLGQGFYIRARSVLFGISRSMAVTVPPKLFRAKIPLPR